MHVGRFVKQQLFNLTRFRSRFRSVHNLLKEAHGKVVDYGSVNEIGLAAGRSFD